VSTVQIFYPFEYENFTTVQWDLVLIEGWFPMIHDFIFLARAEAGGVKIIYYCLDPIFPSVETTLSFDVDGYLTNSRKMETILSDSRVMYLPLAADVEIMKPNLAISRDWDCVYIGLIMFLFDSYYRRGRRPYDPSKAILTGDADVLCVRVSIASPWFKLGNWL
jgi:hypothetical protein